MENFQLSKEQKQKLLSFFKERGTVWIAFLVIGLSGLVPTIVTAFGDAGTNYYTSSTFVFFIIGIALWIQNKEVIKSIEKGDYQTYKTVCKKVGWEYATVENNEILSKNVKKATKKVGILGPRKSMQADDEIGILKTDKLFWAFPLNV